MSISAVRLANFRGFRDAAIELKPLTVLLGPNSAGKSSFGHALAALAHAQWLHSGTAQTTLTPKNGAAAEEWPIDLGRHADLCTTGCSDAVVIELATRFGEVGFGFGGVAGLDDLRLSYLRQPVAPDATPAQHVSTVMVPKLPAVSTGAGEAVRRAHRATSTGLELVRVNELEWRGPSDEPMRLGLNGLLLDTLRYATGTDVQVDTSVRHELGSFLEGLTYLRASRKRPSRGYEAASTARTAIGYAGERTANVLMSSAGVQVACSSLPPIPRSAGEASAVIDTPVQVENADLAYAVGAWLNRLDLAFAVETRPSPSYPGRLEIRVILEEGRPPRDITEVGYAVSQVIPVLVGGLMQSPDSVFVVDLPEAHLHPRPQALLADFFCAMVLSGKAALIETHSEMFFHRLRLRAAMSEELRSKIGVYFFDPHTAGEQCAPPRPVGLGEDDELRWPEGFLQEAWEIETQISAVREGRRLKQG